MYSSVGERCTVPSERDVQFRRREMYSSVGERCTVLNESYVSFPFPVLVPSVPFILCLVFCGRTQVFFSVFLWITLNIEAME